MLDYLKIKLNDKENTRWNFKKKKARIRFQSKNAFTYR